MRNKREELRIDIGHIRTVAEFAGEENKRFGRHLDRIRRENAK